METYLPINNIHQIRIGIKWIFLSESPDQCTTELLSIFPYILEITLILIINLRTEDIPYARYCPLCHKLYSGIKFRGHHNRLIANLE